MAQTASLDELLPATQLVTVRNLVPALLLVGIILLAILGLVSAWWILLPLGLTALGSLFLAASAKAKADAR